MAIMGTNTANTDISVAPVFSTVDTNGLPMPAVLADEARRMPDSAVLTVDAVPPPAIMLNPHFIISFDSANWDENRSVPAIADNGMAMLSMILSTKGI